MRWLIPAVAVVVVMVHAAAQRVMAQDGGEWPRAMGANLVSNGGFEQSAEAAAPVPGWSGEPAVYSVDRAKAHSGTASLRYRNTDAARYVLATQRVKLQPGALYEYVAWICTEDVKGDDFGAALCLEWNDAKGQWMGGSYGEGVKGTRDWTRVRTVVRVPADAAGFTLTCYLRKGMTGAAWFDDVSLTRMAERTMQAVVLEPNYRGQITSDTVRVRALLNWRDSDVKPGDTRQVTAQFQDAAGKPVAGSAPVVKTVTPGEASCDLAIPAPPADKGGAWNLVVRLMDKGGKQFISQTEPLVRKASAAAPAGRVAIDARGRAIVEGKPFFPIGLYLSQVKEDDLLLLGQSKVNCIMPYSSPTRQQMDLAQKHGLRVIYSTKDLYHGTQWSPSWLKSDAQEQQVIRERVREFRDHPALLAWYLNDELPVAYRSRLVAHQQWTAEEDPDHPTWAVLYQVDEISQYLGTCDLIGSDPYPIGNTNPRQARPALAADWTRKTAAGVQHARPVWMVPQLHNPAVYDGPGAGRRSPTIEEVRSMSWQCIAEGATGLVYYSWFDLRKAPDVPFDEHWAGLRQVIAEIDQLAPVILGEEAAGVTVKAAQPWLHVLLRRHDGRDYAVLVNDGEGDGPVQLEIGGGHTAAMVLGDARMVQTGRSVQVELPRLAVAVVEVR